MYNMKTIKGLFVAGMFAFTGLLAGCGGGGAGGTTTTGGTTGGTTTPTASITGTAATGAPLPAGTILTVKDAANRTVPIAGNTVGANGVFNLVVSNPADYTAPFIIRADPSATTSGDELYSILIGSMAANGAYRVNITPVTSLVLYEVTKKSLATVFSAPQTYLPGLTTNLIDQASANVVMQFPALNIANQDFIGQTFSADGSDAYDKALDQIGIATIEFFGDVPTLKDATGTTITYDSATPLYPVASLTVTAGVGQQVADGASFNLISATVKNTQNAPAKGVTVNFSTSAGVLYNNEKSATAGSAVTDESGVARLYLRSGVLTAATVTITAESSDSAASGSTSVKFIPGIPAVVGLSASPGSVAPGNSTMLTASVLDANQNIVADGETVTFKRVTNAGEVTLGTQTTTHGLAVLSYTVGSVAGTETIKAYSANGSNASTTLTIAAAVNGITQISLVPASSSMIANGVSSTTLTATARDSNGNGVPGATIVFSASAGSLSAVTTTNSNGVATATLTAGTNVQTAVIGASANGITATTSVSFTAGAAASIGANASPNAVKPANTSFITLAVLDANQNAVAGEPVTLTFDQRGSGTPSLSATSGTTNANGYLVVTYTAGANAGNDIIRARTSNGFTTTTTIGVSQGNIVIGSVDTTASNGSIAVTSGATIIRALVKDSAGAVVTGATVNFTTTAGTLSAATGTTDASGIASVTLTAGSQVLTARVEATISGFTGSTNVSFTAGAPSTVTVSAAPNAVNPGVSSTIYAYVTDADANPVVGETVTFSIPTKNSGIPTLALTTAVTNVNGLASVTYTAGANTGTDTVTALTSNSKTGSTTISVSPANVVVGSVEVVPNSAAIPVTGSTIVRATVKDTAGQVISGATVTFVSSAGTFNPTTATTDANGLAQATLTAASDILTATITASTGGISGNTQINFTPGAATTVSVSLSPNAVKRGGSSIVTIAVVDGSGNPVTNEPVALSLPTHGSGAPTLNLSNGVTNASGLLLVTYTAGSIDGTDAVKAVASTGASGSANITVNATNAVVATVSVAAGNSSIAVGSGSTSLNATVLDSSNQPLPGISVTFSTTGGTLTPAATATTDANGVATVTLTAGANVQTANINASANNVSASTTVNFTAGAAASIGANAAPNAVNPGGASVLTIAVLDGNGNAVANEPISLTFSARGSGTPSLSATSGTTNANGLLFVTYTAGASTGTDTIGARTSNGFAATTSISVNPVNTVIGSVATTASNGSIAVISGTTIIHALVKDSSGAVVTGATVNFTTSAGTLSAATGTTDASGIASVTLTAGNQVLTARIEATISGFTGSTNVSFTAGAPNTVTVSAAPNAVNPGVSSTIYAYVADDNANPVAGETVTFSIPTKNSGIPTLALTTAVTNANGLASVTYTAGANNGTDTVKAFTSNSKSGTVDISVSASATVVGSVTLLSGATTLPADGASTTTMRATVLTSSGQPANGVTVNFSTSGGSLSAASATTNASGIAEVTLTSSNRTGSIMVIAEAAGFLASQSVTMVAGVPETTKFVLAASPGMVNAGGVSTLTAIVLDANDNPVVGQTVTFTITNNVTNGSVSPITATTSANGIAVTSYTGGNTLGTDTIRAALVGGLTTTTSVQVTGNVLNALSIATSRTTIKSDNSETAVVTVTALSSQNVVVPGVTVTFTADGGQLSASQGVTDANGAVSVNLLPGTLDKSNRTVTVTATATATGVTAVLIPVRVVGSTVALDVTSSTLTAGGASATITVTARDASGLGIYNVPVTLSQSGTGTLNIVAASGNTDANGQYTTTMTGTNPGSATLSATSLGATASQAISVLPGSTFAITSPASDPQSMSTGGTQVFTVNAPSETQVRFATTIGTWSVCPGGTPGGNFCTASVAAGTATATLTSTIAGIAGIQADGLDGSGNVTGTDTHTVAISSAVAASVTLQASASSVQPSTGGAVNTVTLIATLRDSGGQPVGNVPVAFSLVNTTGGGESVSPVIKLSSDGVASTDPLGQARTTFTAGSLPSGQSTSSIQIQATAVGSAAAPATVNIVVGGTAGSVVIGQASHFTESYQATAYTTPMTVQVSDSNGNPVPGGTVVSLSIWPSHYSTGSWVSSAGDGTDCSPVLTGGSPHTNEDVNENLILDSGEDTNGDGSLTPANSTAGTLPSSVVTDANGLAKFDLNFLKQYAAWVKVRVRATALVQGTEATGNLVFTLPWLQVDSDACVLPNSPFN